MAKKISELQKGKELAEAKVRETTATMESLTAELQNEKLNSSSARDWTRKARKETTSIKRAIESLGCKVHFSEDGDCTVGIEINPTEIPQKSLFSTSERQAGGFLPLDHKSDGAVTADYDEDTMSSHMGRVCESLCPYRARDGG